MTFGTFALRDAAGVILAHSIKQDAVHFRKGRVLTCNDLATLRANGVHTVIGLKPAPTDLNEDDAATRIARALPTYGIRLSPASTGRVNIIAEAEGVFVVDRYVIDKLNRIDPAITLACLEDHAVVRRNEMVATIKIIPLAVARASVERVERLLRAEVAMEVKPFSRRRAALIVTELPILKPQVIGKTRMVLEGRLRSFGSELASEFRVPHEGGAVTAAIAKAREEHDLIIIFGASAVADPADVLPDAIRMAGGEVIHVGMPVDPGNLLVWGRLGHIPVIGAPGCARSPKENGFDWMLARVLAGEWPSARDIMGMGVGGLLAEIATRPRPREADVKPQYPLGADHSVKIGAIAVAPGRQADGADDAQIDASRRSVD